MKSTKPIHLGLPILLHNDEEIRAFQVAKTRIETLGEEMEIPFQVGIFLYMLPFAIANREKRETAIKNQERLGLPLLSAQTPILGEHSLAYTPEDVRYFGKEGLLEIAIEQSARLKGLDPHTDLPNFYVDTHQGECLFQEVSERTPGVFSMDEFQSRREEIYEQIKTRFQKLDEFAKLQGLAGMALEIAPTATMEQSIRGGKEAEPEMLYFPFCDLASLNDLSNRNITFDIAHWSATRSAPFYFKKNEDPEGLDFMLKMEDIGLSNPVEDYFIKHPPIEDYFPTTQTFHVSNRTGIGTHIEPDSEAARKWGSDKMPGGDLSKNQFKKLFQYAQENGVPLMIEENYDIANIGTTQFMEADNFLVDNLIDFNR